MSVKLRIATFNLENLDDKLGGKPTLDERIAVMRSQFLRLKADILCLQEVNGQEEAGHPRRLLALKKLLENTPYADFKMASTTKADGHEVYNERNLVTLSSYEIVEYDQYKHVFAPEPYYQRVTAIPKDTQAIDISWERPILHTRVRLNNNRDLHVINVHLKSKLPTPIPGQKEDQYTWRTASAWAEGFFLSSMKRVGQALETRMLCDQLFDDNEDALIVVAGDFNADLKDIPVVAIRGDIENTGHAKLATRVMVPCEKTIPEPSRFSLYHHGKGEMIDHLLVSRSMLAYYQGSEIHNELLHDESIAFATDVKFPESDHAAVIAEFELPE